MPPAVSSTSTTLVGVLTATGASFDLMLAFGTTLPRLRRGVARDLKVDDGKRVGVVQLTERRVLACAVRLLDLGFFRIGSEHLREAQRLLRTDHDAARARDARVPVLPTWTRA